MTNDTGVITMDLVLLEKI